MLLGSTIVCFSFDRVPADPDYADLLGAGLLIPQVPLFDGVLVLPRLSQIFGHGVFFHRIDVHLPYDHTFCGP